MALDVPQHLTYWLALEIELCLANVCRCSMSTPLTAACASTLFENCAVRGALIAVLPPHTSASPVCSDIVVMRGLPHVAAEPADFERVGHGVVQRRAVKILRCNSFNPSSRRGRLRSHDASLNRINSWLRKSRTLCWLSS